MNVNQTLDALAMDLKRVAQGYYSGSEVMASRFVQEAFVRKEELRNSKLKPYLRKLLSKMDEVFKEKDHKKLAEDALMYSTLFQNASLKK
ncbi:MAG: hypothetical protein HYT07_00825 [Candidatus Levybacteria bacterium]|nr:hypothetical protein [Candidatus Levybacteria bacterium]